MPPIVIAAVIGGAAALGGAAIQSSAVKKASNQQQTAGNQALAYEKELLARQEANAKPYLALGNQSLASLGGQPGGWQFNIDPKTGQGYPGGTIPASGSSTPPWMAPSSAQMPQIPKTDVPDSSPQASTAPIPPPPGATSSNYLQPQPAAQASPTMGSLGAPASADMKQAAPEQMVMLIAPDGVTRKSVPRSQMQMYLSKGAKVVNA